MSGVNEVIKATLLMYADCAKSAGQSLVKNWALVVGTLACYVIFMIAQSIFGGMGIVGGFALGLLFIALLTFFYSWIFASARKEKINLQNLYEFDFSLFQSLISVAFILWIATDFLLRPMLGHNALLLYSVQLVINILLNSVAEVIGYHRYESLHAVSYSATFTRDNWIEWFAPFVFISAPIFAAWGGFYVLKSLATMPVLIPSLSIYGAAGDLFMLLGLNLPGLVVPVSILLVLFFALFRAELFIALESGSRRQRIFKSKQ